MDYTHKNTPFIETVNLWVVIARTMTKRRSWNAIGLLYNAGRCPNRIRRWNEIEREKRYVFTFAGVKISVRGHGRGSLDHPSCAERENHRRLGPKWKLLIDCGSENVIICIVFKSFIVEICLCFCAIGKFSFITSDRTWNCMVECNGLFEKCKN